MKDWRAGIYQISEWVMRLAALNLLWIGLTLLGGILLGWAPATVALFSVIRKWIQGDQNLPIARSFWSSFKSNFLKSQVLGFIIIIMGFLLFINFNIVMIWQHAFSDALFVVVMCCIVIYLVTIAFIFPVYVHYELPLIEYIGYAMVLGLTHPLKFIQIVAGGILLFYVFRFIPSLLPFFSISVIGYIMMWSAYQAILSIERRKNRLSHHL